MVDVSIEKFQEFIKALEKAIRLSKLKSFGSSIPEIEKRSEDFKGVKIIVEKVEDALKEGQEIEVKLIEIDKKTGKMQLSRQVFLPRPPRAERPKE